MSLVLYHATTAVLKLYEPMTAHRRTVNAQKARIDEMFDQFCPSTGAPRSNASFAGDDPAFCAAYLVSEKRNETDAIRIYRVDISDPSKHPMRLINHARFFLKDKSTLAKIIQEYWMPTHTWICWEYLATSMTPVAIEPTPDAIAIAGAKFRYGKDIDFAQKLWPNPRA